MFRNLKMSVKLMLGFGITVAISAIMMIIAIMNLQSVGGLTDKLYQSPLPYRPRALCFKRSYRISAGKCVGWFCMKTLLI